MANGYGSQPITGKSKRKQTQPRSTAIQAALVSPTALADKSSVLNDATLSGKQEGAVFITKATNGDLNFAIAVAGGPTDAWCTLTKNGVYTPA